MQLIKRKKKSPALNIRKLSKRPLTFSGEVLRRCLRLQSIIGAQICRILAFVTEVNGADAGLA
jgi:hypothetical protein